MKSTGKKIVSFLLAGLLATSMAACGSSGTSSAAPASSTAPASGTSSADTEPSEPITLTLWHQWPSGQIHDIIETYVEQYQKDHPNVKINVDATQADEYQNTKLKVAAASGAQADIFDSYGAGYSKPFVDAGVVLPLDEYFQKYGMKDKLLGGVLDYFTYNGKVYGIPLKKWAGVLFCNTDLFTKYNVEYPKTWDQMMSAVKTFRSNGVTPMVLGAKDAWHIGMIQNALAVRTAGVDAAKSALTGESSFATPEIEKSAQLLIDLNKAGAFVDGTLGVSSDEAQMEFYMGKVPMYYSGSWTAADCENKENSIKGKIKVMPLPTVDGGKGDATTFSGGAVDCYMINAKTKYPDEAVKFAFGLTQYQSTESYKIGDSLPAWKTGDIDKSQVNPVLAQIEDLTANATGYVLAWDTFLSGAAIDAHYNLLQGLIGGTVTPQQFATEMEAANKKQLAGQSSSSSAG